MTLESLLDRLEGVRRNGTGAVAICPAHSDRRPSLSVGEGSDGYLLLHCHAGCSAADIVGRLGLSMTDLFPSNVEARIRSKPQAQPLSDVQVERMHAALLADPEASHHVTDVLKFSPEAVERMKIGLHAAGERRWLAYPYRSGGAWTFANCRSLDGEKDFTRVPAGQRTTLFNADELTDGGVALLVEGERDALAALSIRLDAEVKGGATVVALPGAQHVRLAADTLARQRLVYLFTDADEPGEKAALDLARLLGPERCLRVRIPGHKDLGDCLAAAGQVAALDAALDAVDTAKRIHVEPETTSATEPPAPGETAVAAPEAVRIAFSEIENPPREQFIIGTLLPMAKSSVLYGPTSVGKSAAIAQIALACASGSESLWGLPLLPGGGPVLIYSAEDSLDDWRRKAAAIHADGSISVTRALDRLWVIDQSEGVARLSEVVSSTTEEGGMRVTRHLSRPTAERDRIIEAAQKIGAKLIVVETASRLVDDEDNPSFAALQASLGAIARSTGAGTLTSHHATKAASKEGDSSIESARGGGAFVANARSAFSLFPAKPEDSKDYRDRFPEEDLITLEHGKPTSSTRRSPPILLVRCSTPYGAVLHRPEDVRLSPEQEAANAARVDADRERERQTLGRLYDTVGEMLKLGPVSQTRLRDRVSDIGVPKRRLDALVLLALDRGVLKPGAWTGGRGRALTLGHDPRKPNDSEDTP